MEPQDSREAAHDVFRTSFAKDLRIPFGSIISFSAFYETLSEHLYHS